MDTRLMSTYHYRDGIHFRRLADPPGCVEIAIPPSVMANGVIRIDADSWPSIVAAVGHEGETSWSSAMASLVHLGRGGEAFDGTSQR